MELAFYIRFAGFTLCVQGVEGLFQALCGRFTSVDGALKSFLAICRGTTH